MRKALKIQILPKKIILTLLITNILIIISSTPKYYLNLQTSRTQTGTALYLVLDIIISVVNFSTLTYIACCVHTKIEYMYSYTIQVDWQCAGKYSVDYTKRNTPP